MKFIWSSVVCILISVSAWGATPADIRNMITALDVGTKDAQMAAILELSNHAYVEVVEALIARLGAEAKKGPLGTKNGADQEIVEALIVSIGEVGTEDQRLKFHEAVRNLVNSSGDVKQRDLARNMIRMPLAEANRRMQERTGKKLGKIPKGEVDQLADDVALPKKLAAFRKSLEAEVLGQPHVIERLVELRARDVVYGSRVDPEVLWFLGPPGTGKDTAVYAYANSIHGDESAWKKHVFRVDPLRAEGDLWALLGSATGYVGSTSFPPVLKFLVEHSGGRYALEETEKEGQFKIVENPDWKPGQVLDGYSAPEAGVIYLDEFHDWSEAFKNAVVKKAIEYEGLWKVNNPNGGLSEIRVPITVMIASNDAMHLVTSREKNGTRFGKPLSYDQMKEKADKLRNDKQALRMSVLAGTKDVNSGGGGNSKGTSEELLNRIKDSSLLLFDPLSTEAIRSIARKKLDKWKKRLASSSGGYANVTFSYTDELVKFLQEYHYVAEENARQIDDRVQSMVENTVFKAIVSGRLEEGDNVSVVLDVNPKSDKTWELVFTVRNMSDPKAEAKKFAVDIEDTYADKARKPISDEQIDKLLLLEEGMNSRVVGQKNAIKEISRAILVSEEGRQGIKSTADAKETARVFMALGPTSTGKTETAKALAEEMFGSRDAAVTIDFSQVQTVQDLKLKILGTRDGLGNPIPSDFMKNYDRNLGRVVFVFDEIANVRDKEILNTLYDILREPVVSTFSDGRERIMSNVVIMITGNASQELLAQLPQDLPEEVLRAAWTDIYRQLNADPNLRREVLERYFTVPFIARVGDERIFFYEPLGYAAVRELMVLKLDRSLKELQPKEGRRGWNIRFTSRDAYLKALDVMEREGFILKEQGASIDRFIGKQFSEKLRELLLKNKVPSESNIAIEFSRVTTERDEKDKSKVPRHRVVFNIMTSDHRNLELVLDGKYETHQPDYMIIDQIMTAFHEAGHSIVRSALMGDLEAPKYVRIIPGVTKIAGEWIYYAGVAGSEEKVRTHLSMDIILREVAVLLGGYVAEQMIVKGGLSSAGPSNDFERATRLLETAFLKWGMSSKLGNRVREKDSMSQGELEVLNQEVAESLRRAEKLARSALQANADAFVSLGNELSRKGQLDGEEILAIEKANNFITETDVGFESRAAGNGSRFNQTKDENRRGHRFEFVTTAGILPTTEVVNLAKVLAEERLAELETVKIEKGPYMTQAELDSFKEASAMSCSDLLSKK